MASLKKVAFVLLSFTLTPLFSAGNSTAGIDSVISSYIKLKDAFISGEAKTINERADRLIKSINMLSLREIIEGNRDALLKDAMAIVEAQDLSKKKNHFANLSANMITVSKNVKHNTAVMIFTCKESKLLWMDIRKESRNPLEPQGNCSEFLQDIK